MAKRPPLKSNVAKPADTAAKVAEAERITGQLTGKAQVAAPAAPDDETEMQTASYVLPVEMIDLLSQLAALRLERDKMQKRAHRRAVAAAAKAGVAAPPGPPPTQARRSASAIVREALEAHRAAIEAEIEDLK